MARGESRRPWGRDRGTSGFGCLAESGLRRLRPSRAFTIVDVLVTMAVVALLIAMLLPGLSRVREASRRVVCNSNLRQVGLGLVLYADGNRDLLPPSVFISKGYDSPENMMTLRVDPALGQRTRTNWDGLGHLYSGEILHEAQVFYCPSHHGQHSFADYAERWLGSSGELVGNYHYRGEGPNGARHLTYVEPSRAAMAADGLRTIEDYNHVVGLNVLRADLSLLWVDDPEGRISRFIEESDDHRPGDFELLWDQLDEPDENLLEPGS